jgi:hypothetical protein
MPTLNLGDDRRATPWSTLRKKALRAPASSGGRRT